MNYIVIETLSIVYVMVLLVSYPAIANKFTFIEPTLLSWQYRYL